MIRYNILASIKRTLDYDTIGGLFGDMYLGVHELTVVEKIWAIIIEVVAVVSELIGMLTPMNIPSKLLRMTRVGCT